MNWKSLQGFATALLATSLAVATPGGVLAGREGAQSVEPRAQRVLLISIDGFHAVDLANFVQANPDSTLATLSGHGVTFTNASTSRPSDSFPGLLALVTGGSPNSTGVWYDDSYDRRLAPPLNNSQGGISGTCTAGVFPGTEVLYDETVDKNLNLIDGGGGIDVNALPRDPANGCKPVFPHSFLRVNTIFEVIKAAGGRTAWADKHLAYDLVNGPSGSGVQDLYTPEIAALGDATRSLPTVITNDNLKVDAILNEIAGKNHNGTAHPGVPTIFGMNFQAVSVGQKLTVGGGYTDLQGTPGMILHDALHFVDTSLGKMVDKLKDEGLYDTTLIIITAKHGQSPIDKNKLHKLNTASSRPSKILTDPDQVTEDDIALIWFQNQNPGTIANDVAMLEADRDSAMIQKIFVGAGLKLVFNDPTVDSRVPDIIVQPELGVIYTGSGKKIAEHGGFSEDDTHVALLVSLAGWEGARKIKSPVET
ncbi:MAG TPA: alkaline phosphatase family protein, partial [Candidatus Acidoferrales bacterium]|nr:alkaline phosphatase family protein [Candidatus Acidoferrales bacterium]